MTLISDCCEARVNEDQRICMECHDHCTVILEDPCDGCGGNVDYHSGASSYYMKEHDRPMCDECLERLDAQFEAAFDEQEDYQGE